MITVQNTNHHSLLVVFAAGSMIFMTCTKLYLLNEKCVYSIASRWRFLRLFSFAFQQWSYLFKKFQIRKWDSCYLLNECYYTFVVRVYSFISLQLGMVSFKHTKISSANNNLFTHILLYTKYSNTMILIITCKEHI